MTSAELCDPLFRYICRLNRSFNAGIAPDGTRVRMDLIQLLDKIAAKAQSEPNLRDQFDAESKGKLNRVLVYFVDSMITDSNCPFALSWQRIEVERYGEQVGDERFWMLLNETLEDESPAATDRLAVYYQCIGLGFTGLYTGQPEHLRSKMNQIAQRINKTHFPNGSSGSLCPEAYEYTDRSDLIEKPPTGVMGIAIVVIGLIITLFIANVFLYHEANSELADALNKINAMNPQPAATDETP